jgi:hypothetical protein
MHFLLYLMTMYRIRHLYGFEYEMIVDYNTYVRKRMRDI